MGFLLRSKAEGNVGPCSSLDAALSSLGLLSTSKLLLGVDWSPPALAPSLLEPGLWEKAASPPSPVPMSRCPAQHPQGGDVPSSPPALSKAGTEARSQYCLLRPEGCAFFFFLKHHFQQHHPLPRKSTPQNMTALGGNSPWVFGNVWGNIRKKKKKAHTLLFALSIGQPTHSNGQRHRLHFIQQGTQESTLTRELLPATPLCSWHGVHPLGRDSGSF